MLQGLFRMNAGWASEMRKLHPAERTDESLLVSESLRFGRWRPHFPSSRRSTATPPCPPLRGSNHFYRSLCSAFLNLITDTRSPKQPTLCSWSALNNTQLLAFIALIIWTVEGEGDEKKKSISQMLAKRIWGARRGHLPSLWQMRGDSNARQSPYGYILEPTALQLSEEARG